MHIVTQQKKSAFDLSDSMLCNGLGSMILQGGIFSAIGDGPAYIDDKAISECFWLAQSPEHTENNSETSQFITGRSYLNPGVDPD